MAQASSITIPPGLKFYQLSPSEQQKAILIAHSFRVSRPRKYNLLMLEEAVRLSMKIGNNRAAKVTGVGFKTIYYYKTGLRAIGYPIKKLSKTRGIILKYTDEQRRTMCQELERNIYSGEGLSYYDCLRLACKKAGINFLTAKRAWKNGNFNTMYPYFDIQKHFPAILSLGPSRGGRPPKRHARPQSQ